MKTIGAFDAKTNLSRLLREVEVDREVFVIERNRKKVATLVPYRDGNRAASDPESIVERFRQLRARGESDATPVKELISEGRKR
jgi:antitoxin (DNA-binding transcriptional repressor) of toxin-antitoxin stability system